VETSVAPEFRFSGGTLPELEQGKRSDLEGCYDILKADGPRGLKRCLEKYPGSTMRYCKGLQFALTLLHEPSSEFTPRLVHVVMGDTGTGKSRLVYREAHIRTPSSVCVLPAPSEASWLDGYRDQESVILDDYAPSARYPHAVLLRMLDGYEYPAPVKGGYVVFRPRNIFITSNFHPYEWYPNGDYPALKRRISTCQIVGDQKERESFCSRHSYIEEWGEPITGVVLGSRDAPINI